MNPATRFLLVFAAILALGFTAAATPPVNDRLVEPYTAAVARGAAVCLDALGYQTYQAGTVLRARERPSGTPSFAVHVKNGCNGLEALLVFVGGILAYPTSWRARFLGLVAGGLLLQGINLVRVAALYLTGLRLPQHFDNAHTVVAQTLVILSAVALWAWWVARFTPAAREGAAA